MKQYLLLISVLVLSGFISYGQKIHITGSGNTWKVGFQGYANSGLYYHMTYSYGPDTVLQGNTYRRVLSASQNIPIGPVYGTSGFPPYPDAIREDTLTGMVYSFQYGDSVERVFFNYNLHAGDTITFVFYNTPPIKDSVVNVDSVQINGVYHKIFRLCSRPSSTYTDFTFVEGIGSLHYPFYHLSPVCFEGSTNLLCFAQGTLYPGFSVPYSYNTDCLIYTIVNGTFTNASNCFDMQLVAVPEIMNKPDLSVSPNPFFDVVRINNMSEKMRANICDITGREVYNGTLSAQEHDIYLPDLQNGMYMLRLWDNNNNTYYFKILKE